MRCTILALTAAGTSKVAASVPRAGLKSRLSETALPVFDFGDDTDRLRINMNVGGGGGLPEELEEDLWDGWGCNVCSWRIRPDAGRCCPCRSASPDERIFVR